MLLIFFSYPEHGVSCGSGFSIFYLCHYSYFLLTIMSMFESLPSVQISGILLQTHLLGLSLLSQLCLLCSLAIIFFGISYYFYKPTLLWFQLSKPKPLFIDYPHALFLCVALAIKVCFLVHFTSFFYLFLSSHFFLEPDIE